MVNMLLESGYWSWWLLGLGLIIIEILVPGTFFLWLGLAALCVGGAVFLFPGLAWQFQWLLFALLAIGAIGVWQLKTRRRSRGTGEPILNRRAEQYVGRIFTLEAPIANGQGRLRVDDSSWKVAGTDCPAGTRVRVTGVDGVILKVTAEPQ